MSSNKLGGYSKKALSSRMLRLGIKEADIIEGFTRSRGPGGQKVNKTSSCVYLKHLPTGIEVKCQKERSQALNRYVARKILVNKIESSIFKKISQQQQKLERLRRQNRPRPRRIKLMLLEDKRRRAEKKLLRAKIDEID